MPTAPRHPATSVLFFYVLGKLHEAHASAIDRHLTACRRCHKQRRLIELASADLALALEPVPVPHLLRESLLHSAREVHRLSDALPTLRYALRYSLAEAQQVLRVVDDPHHWQQEGGAWVLPLAQKAPRRAALVRLSLVSHYTLKPEQRARAWVLQGHARGSVRRLGAGQAKQLRPGDKLSAYPGPDLLVLLVWSEAAVAASVTRKAATTAQPTAQGAALAAAHAP